MKNSILMGRFLSRGFRPALALWTMLGGCLWGATARAQAPANDAWSAAITLTGASANTSGSNAGATREAGEPNHNSQTTNSSVWWKWVAPADGTCIVDTNGSAFDTVLAVYTGGSVGALTEVASDDEGGSNGTSRLSFSAVAGTTYHIAVASWDDTETGPIQLHLTLFDSGIAQPGDAYADAAALPSSIPAAAIGSTVNATTEAGEPFVFAGDRTVWYSWTAPTSTQIKIVAHEVGGYSHPKVAVYSGDTLANAEIESALPSFSFTQFAAIAGQSYRIQVNSPSYYPALVQFSLELKVAPPPPANDNFAGAQSLTGFPVGATAGTLESASREENEPGLYILPSVWYRWTAPAAGPVSVIVADFQGGFPQAPRVYTGAALGSLSPVGEGVFTAAAGTQYWIQVVGSVYEETGGAFNLKLQPPPPNDNFSAAQVLSGALPLAVNGTSEGASHENGETFGGPPESVWYRWVPAASGRIAALVQSADPDAYTSLGVFTGAAVDALTDVLAPTDAGYQWVSFNVTAGTTYRLRVSSSPSAAFTLHLVNPPANDAFASAATLAGASATGTVVGATTELDEPSASQSVWWNYTAPASGNVTFLAAMNAGTDDLKINVFQGSTIAALTQVAKGWGRASFQAVGGQTYRIQVDHPGMPLTANGTFTLSVFPAPANDSYANAALIGSAPATVSGYNIGATREIGEPGRGAAFLPNAPSATVWWRWQAGNANLVNVDTIGSEFDTVLEVFTGSSLSTLTRIRLCDDAAADGSSRVAFVPTLHGVYYFRVSSKSPRQDGRITLHLAQFNQPTTAAENIRYGRSYLEGRTAADLDSADSHFATAVTQAPTDPEAAVLRAATKLARVQRQTAFTDLMAQWGFAAKRVNHVTPRWTPPRNAQGVANPPAGANFSQATAYANANLFTEFDAFDAGLAKVTSNTFALQLSDSEAGCRFMTVDYGDVTTMRGIGKLVKAILHLNATYNTDVSIKDVLDLRDAGQLTAEKLLAKMPDALKQRAGVDQRASFKAQFQAANGFYQNGMTFIRNRADPASIHHLIFIPETRDRRELEIADNFDKTAQALNGEILWEGIRVNLSPLMTTPTPYSALLAKFKGNLVRAGTAPDPTFVNSLPTGTHALVNQILGDNRLLFDVSTFLTWIEGMGQDLPETERDAAADPDGDGLNNFLEYVFALDPTVTNAPGEFESQTIQPNPANGGQKHYVFTFIRLKNVAGLSYKVLVSDDLKVWDATEAQIEAVGSPVTQPDGITEQVTVRVKQPVTVAGRKYLKIRATGPQP